jgi:glutathionylspermidine synthase
VRRDQSPPRPDWQGRVEQVGLPHHTAADGTPYWDESACYVFSEAEVDELESATAELHQLCVAAAREVIENARWAELAIPPGAVPLIERSWREQARTLYGRFDLAYDGKGPPRLLEYNADTPTALVEAAVAQWYWLQDVHPEGDQFNSLHERLVAAWGGVVPAPARAPGGPLGATPPAAPLVHFASADDPEDVATLVYLRDTAEQAGLRTAQLLMAQIGWDADRGRFVDLDERPIDAAFKLYPWEWMAGEAFAAHLADAAPLTRWVEPAWKMVLSNKGILAVLWELFPDHPNLLPAYFDEWRLEAYAKKPLLSREGANVSLVMFGEEVATSGGDYGAEGYVYQALAPLPNFDGRVPVLGSWVVAGEPAGMGVREADGLITTNTSRFVPHRIG